MRDTSSDIGPVDIAIIGAGPAGLAAAAEAVEGGRRVVLIDINPRLGGQYWRHGVQDDALGAAAPRWHHGWRTYRKLSSAVREGIALGRITHLAESHVWALDRTDDGFILRLAHIAEARESHGRQELSSLHAQRVVLATGTHDRHLPVPGWTLPGVMAAGGIQAFIKVQETVPGHRVVLAGTGPFLLAAADSVVQAGGKVLAIVESSSLTRWFPRGVLGAGVPSKGVEGAQYVAALAAHRIPYLTRHAVTTINGADRVQSVSIAKVDAKGARIPGTDRIIDDVDLVGLGWGFTPQTELLMQAGAQTRIDADGSLVGVVDDRLVSSVPGLYVAGEITGVKGAVGAVADGRIAGRAAAGATVRRRDRVARARHVAFARAMHRAHPVPAAWEQWLTDETTVCRCEEVSYRHVREAREQLDIVDPRSLKGASRVGMGWCQGRMCGLAATCLARGGTATGDDADTHAAQSVSHRPVALPIELGQLADDAPEVFPEAGSSDAKAPRIIG